MGSVFKGDVGTKIILSVGTNVSAATVAKIKYRKPLNESGEWVATIDGSTIYYITQAGDLDQSGEWKLQAYIELPGWSGHGGRTRMIVSPLLI